MAEQWLFEALNSTRKKPSVGSATTGTGVQNCAKPAPSQAPTPTTKLRVAPYFNVNGEDGLTCQGTMRSPEDAGVATIPLWERAFFQSEFTHQTGARRLTIHPGGFLGLWASLAGSRKPFPVEHLAPTNQTLLEFVTREWR